ncbi:hypothetical protein [Pseudomonas aeruginosa]|uniref:hypothetical protein n=1 Tax=Pseudomonas aeruginosa TaxID=287 RepID=UPI00071BEF36|nr:hypothetical protein [Pseudomonas aeruginosa]KSD32397.1 hypothetical protein AO902_21425 [Pseudomonas aeruginosa]MCV4185428.1 hypothetical protein [Pseudomonas aeruginosa]NTS91988.1 hypothetical protein [Pseudomonas aeruginosa]HCE6993881.1 hypothetical protein [Pseudomonas aeruginosa]HDZ3441984.1 hypothetical protein [Pseudomonas aeruginosa]
MTESSRKKSATTTRKKPSSSVSVRATKKAKAEVGTGDTDLNKVQRQKRQSKARTNMLKMRAQLWSELDVSMLWDRNIKDGFSTIPRTLSLIVNIIDDLAKRHTGKSIPAGKAYFGLWCRVWDENMLVIDNEASYAIEAGYIGERNVTTWRQQMKVLDDLGFISAVRGAYGPYNNVLMFNPYLVLRRLRSMIPVETYQVLLRRAMEIGADADLIEITGEGQ